MRAESQTKMDEGAIIQAYEDLLDWITGLLDEIKINGFSPLFDDNPVLGSFNKLLCLMEGELLIQWKLREDGDLVAVFERQKSWLNRELRAADGFFDTYNALVAALWRTSDRRSALAGRDLWKTSVFNYLTDKKKLSCLEGAFHSTAEPAVTKNLASLLYKLIHVSPYHLSLSFLNLIEIGAGPRPEITDPGSSVADSRDGRDTSGTLSTYLEISESASPESVEKAISRFWGRSVGDHPEDEE